mmetsp:Transcript_44139/g.136402  ORF Transcript_44139/g.136402 Transcript_44139/m.136402 type:complete len:235 (+) Transcript_44139:361-1065(+)
MPRATVADVLAPVEEAVAVLPVGAVHLHLPTAHEARVELPNGVERAEEGHVTCGVAHVPVLQGARLRGGVHPVEVEVRESAPGAGRGGVPLRAGLARLEDARIQGADLHVAEGEAEAVLRARERLVQLSRSSIGRYASGEMGNGTQDWDPQGVDLARDAAYDLRAAGPPESEPSQGIHVGRLEGLADGVAPLAHGHVLLVRAWDVCREAVGDELAVRPEDAVGARLELPDPPVR